VEEVEKLTKYMSVRTVGILRVPIRKKTTVYTGVCDIPVDTGRIMDLTLDNVIRFEEMQNLLLMSLMKCLI
jgi:ATP-dependent RNA helicase RhlE